MRTKWTWSGVLCKTSAARIGRSIWRPGPEGLRRFPFPGKRTSSLQTASGRHQGACDSFSSLIMEKNDDLVPVAQDAPVETFDDGSVRIASVDIDGRGVARRDGKVIFIEGGLVGERVGLNVYRRKPSYELAQV